MSAKSDGKFKLPRKKSIGNSNTLEKHKKNVILKRTGSFHSPQVETKNVETKNDIKKLDEQSKKMMQALGYVKDVIEKGIVDLLSGSVSIILELIIELDSNITLWLGTDISKLKEPKSNLIKELMKLIQWADIYLISSSNLNRDKKSGINHVCELKIILMEYLTTLKNLVELKANKKIKENNLPIKLDFEILRNPNPSVQPGPLLKYQTESLPLYGNSLSSSLSYSADDILNWEEECPPPKPPLPDGLVLPSMEEVARRLTLHDLENVPPPLPLKQRDSKMTPSLSSSFMTPNISSSHMTPSISSSNMTPNLQSTPINLNNNSPFVTNECDLVMSTLERLRESSNCNNNEDKVCDDPDDAPPKPPLNAELVSHFDNLIGNQTYGIQMTLYSEKNEQNVMEEDSLHPPPLPPKKKAVEAYMSMIGPTETLSVQFPAIANISYYEEQFIQHNRLKRSTYVYRSGRTTSYTMSSPSTNSDFLHGSGEIDYVNTDDCIENKFEEPTTPKSSGSNNALEDIPILERTNVADMIVLNKTNKDVINVVAGSVDVLIVYVTTSSDFLYQNAFLTTYRSFITPTELIEKLLCRFNAFDSKGIVGKKYAKYTFSIIVRVIDDLCTETDSSILSPVMQLVYRLLNNGELKEAQKLRERIVAKCNHHNLKQQTTVTLLSSYQVTAKVHIILEFKTQQIAEQMTLIDSELFHKIDISEILLWSREQIEELSPNLTRFTEHFNRMSYWCRTQILEKNDQKEREKHFVKFIKIMKHLRTLNNFNSYLAILSALDSAPIRRLDWTKQAVDMLGEFLNLIDSSSSFRIYRQALSLAEPPCIPYIGLVLQDLTFVHIGNNDKDEEKRVNFVKCWQIFTILDSLSRFKMSCRYSFKKNEKIISFFNNFENHICEESLWQISEMIKPRQRKKSISKLTA